MNILLSWNRSFDEKDFSYLIEELGVDLCSYFQLSDITPSNNNCQYEELKIYESSIYVGLKYCKRNINQCDPLDTTLIQAMKPYEATAMEIINRWRRTILPDGDGYQNIKEAYYTYLRFWNHYIIKNKVELLILPNIPHIPTFYMCYAICKAKGIPTILRIRMNSLPGWTISNEYLTTSIEETGVGFKELYEINKKKYGEFGSVDLAVNLTRYVENYSKTREKVEREIIRQENTSAPKIVINWMKRGKAYILHGDYKILLNKIRYLIKESNKSKGLLQYVQGKEIMPDLSERYFYLPLHYQPEATTLSQAGIYTDQSLMVNMVSSFLPSGVKLYVKEHPAYWEIKEKRESITENRSKNFYETIISLKNVILIKHDYDSLELLDNCMGVVTANGTIGFEAAFFQKAVISYGNMHYNYMPSVYRIRTNHDCANAIEQICNNKHTIMSKYDIEIFLKTLEEFTLIAGIGDTIVDDVEAAHYGIEGFNMWQTKKIVKFILAVLKQ